MDITGFAPLAYYLVVASLLLSVALFYLWEADNKQKLVRATCIALIPLSVIAFVLVNQDLRIYETQGKVVEVSTHGDGSDDSDYSVVDTDSSNVALIVPRSTLPSISAGDQIKLQCRKLEERSESVYYCESGEVTKPATPE